MGTRSLPYTLWQLLLRPGYLIGDYISGRRQVSFPPIKMLVFVALFVYILFSIMIPEGTAEKSADNTLVMDYVFDFFETHYDVAMMFFTSMLIIPTYFIFRFAPRCDHHTLPEGFFIQVFNSTIILMLALVLYSITRLFIHDEGVYITLLSILFMVIVYRSYHQLFGYSHCSTLWRTLAVCASALMSLYILVLVDFLMSGGAESRAQRILSFIMALLSGAVIVIVASYLISRRTAKLA